MRNSRSSVQEELTLTVYNPFTGIDKIELSSVGFLIIERRYFLSNLDKYRQRISTSTDRRTIINCMGFSRQTKRKKKGKKMQFGKEYRHVNARITNIDEAVEKIRLSRDQYMSVRLLRSIESIIRQVTSFYQDTSYEVPDGLMLS